MESSINTSSSQKPKVYNFYFSEQLNVSRVSTQRKDSRVSSLVASESGSQQNSNNRKTQTYQKQFALVQQNLLQQIQSNQFITPFKSERKNTTTSVFGNQEFFNTESLNSKNITVSIEKIVRQNENDNQFLLDSDTYKQICMEQHQKKVQAMSMLNFKDLATQQNFCQIHQKPFQIVCIQDKALVCSHCAIFGQHKSHCLGPLNKIERTMQQKRFQVKQVIHKFKSLQLAIQQKSYTNRYVEQINTKKSDTKKEVSQKFNQIRQILNTYEQSLQDQLEKFYNVIIQKLTHTVNHALDYNNSHSFNDWRKQAINILQKLDYQEISKQNQIYTFLSNFAIPQLSLNNSRNTFFEQKSLQKIGKQYFNELQQNLNVQIDNLMAIIQKFQLMFDKRDYKSFVQFITTECILNIDDLLQDNSLHLIKNLFKQHQNMNFTLKSFKNIQQTSKSLHLRIPQPEFNLQMTLNTPITSLKTSKVMISPNKTLIKSKIQTENNLSLSCSTFKKSFKQNRTQSKGNLKRLQTTINQQKINCEIFEVKSSADNKNINKRKISPCIKNIVLAQKQNHNQFNSTASSRITRYKSRDAAFHSRNTSDSKDAIFDKNFKQKKQVQVQNNEPLKILQQFQNSNSQTFDLNNCKLNDTEIIYFIQKAAKLRKIKNFKLCSNEMTVSGIQKILPYLSHCNILNLSGNKLSQSVMDLLLKKKQRIPHLKILNISNNKLNQRKIKQKVIQFKKMGVVITL